MKADLKLQKTAPYFERIRNIPKLSISRHIIIAVLLFTAAIFVGQILEVILMAVIAFGIIGAKNAEDIDIQLILQLYLTVVVTAFTFLFCRLCDNRPVKTMFLTSRKMIPDYLTGALLGMAMMTAVALAAWGCGALQFDGFQSKQKPLIMILLFIGWILQGFSEEIACRGWLMSSIGTHHSAWSAVTVSALMFALLHISNNGFSLLAVVNLFLFGVAASLFVLRTGSIWGAAAMHSVWNWAQGNFFGLQVSGLQTGSTIFKFSQTGNAAWIGGEKFGLEAGVGTTAVTLIVIVILLLLPQRKTQEEQENGTV